MLKIKTSQNRGAGLNIQAHMRDLLMSHANMEITQAQELADLFAQTVAASEWLELSNGMTFNKTFDPAASQSAQNQNREGGI